MQPIHVRGYCDRAAASSESGTPIRFVASTADVARDGLKINADAWDLANFRKNPTFLWAHDYMGNRPPIGRVEKVGIENGALVADVVFDQGDEFARDVERKYRQGFLNAVSVGWDTHAIEPPKDGGMGAPVVTNAELLDISGVPIPGDANALIERSRRALAKVGDDLVALARADDGGDMQKALDAATAAYTLCLDYQDAGEPLAADDYAKLLRALAAVIEALGGTTPRGTTDAETRTSETTVADADADTAAALHAAGEALRELAPPDGKRGALPFKATPKADENAAWDAAKEVGAADSAEQFRTMFAWISPDGDPDIKSSYKLPHHRATGEVVWRGVAAAMARLLQAGTDIPDGDRRAVYNHLRRHYQQFDKEAPEFRSVADLDALDGPEIRGLFLEGEPDLTPDVFAWAEQRAGKVLSQRNRDRLEQATSLIQEVLKTSESAPADSNDDEPNRDYQLLQDIAAGLANIAA